MLVYPFYNFFLILTGFDDAKMKSRGVSNNVKKSS